jgi:hypothetical protein
VTIITMIRLRRDDPSMLQQRYRGGGGLHVIEISIITIHHHHIGNADVNKMVAIEELNRSQDIVMDDTNTLPSVNCVTPLVDHPLHGVDSMPCKELQQMYSTNKTFAVGKKLDMYYKSSFDFLSCFSSFLLSSYITLTRIKML